MKECNNSKCNLLGNPQPLINFSKNKNNKDGFSNRCKECVKQSVKQSYLKNREHYIKIESKRNKIWRTNNPEKYQIQKDIYNTKFKEKGYWITYYQNNKEKLLNYSKQYHVVEKRKMIWKQRYQNDIPFKLKNIMKANFHLFFKDKGKNKNLSFNKIASYTFNQLKIHLECNFRKGMDWSNFGILWEIHHIKPQNLFNICNIEEVRECWELSNLFPLWKTTEISNQFGDNIRGNRNIGKKEVYNPSLDV